MRLLSTKASKANVAICDYRMLVAREKSHFIVQLCGTDLRMKEWLTGRAGIEVRGRATHFEWRTYAPRPHRAIWHDTYKCRCAANLSKSKVADDKICLFDELKLV